MSGAWLAAAPPAAGQQESQKPRAAGGTGLVQPPRLLGEVEVARQIDAVHLRAVQDGGTTGEVYLKFRVLTDSTVDSLSIVVERATSAALVEPAKTITRRMRFVPARVDGRPAPVWITFPFFFDGRREAESEEGTYDPSAINQIPRLRNGDEVARQVEARYPPAMLESGGSGYVILRLRVLENGTVDSLSVMVEMTTDPAFEEPAATVSRSMRFTPAMIGRRPVKVWITVPIYFGVDAPAPRKEALPEDAPPPASPARPSG